MKIKRRTALFIVLSIILATIFTSILVYLACDAERYIQQRMEGIEGVPLD